MNNSRPINLNPLTIKLPVMALVSILHRISGVLIFFLIPILLSSLSKSLASPEGLAQVKEAWQGPLAQMFIWLFIGSLVFHLIAGIRHLLMDIHIGDSLCAGRWGARCVIISFILVFGLMYCCWR
ncbi:MAG: succinate dehydrogenase, cytochrome b556 subunit [Proteobacteria bacterium]|nr:succinate dehydrogenase, cytochrome b556 subunit [Pseudomonadota bacterium]